MFLIRKRQLQIQNRQNLRPKLHPAVLNNRYANVFSETHVRLMGSG